MKGLWGFACWDRAEEPMNDRYPLLQGIIDSYNLPIFSVDRNYCYTCFNKSHAGVMKTLYDAEIELGKNLLDYHTVAADRESAKNNIDGVFQGKCFSVESWVGEGKAKRCFEISHNTIKDSGGEIIGAAVFASDTTEHRQTEQLKDDFIGMISHEVRTPLTVIIGALNVVMAKGIADRESQELIQDAIDCTQVLNDIVENLLELSKYKADSMFLNKEPADIGMIAGNVVRRMQGKSAKHRLVSELPADLPLIPVDPVRVERILVNLVDNAIKYSTDGGEVKILMRHEDDRLIVGVRDSGPGISKENRKILFRSFEQLDIEPRHAMQGVGLGLKVCRILVEAHGGTIWVESEPGKGSTFFFTLPAGY
jgi:signal transduction histidine kinase